MTRSSDRNNGSQIASRKNHPEESVERLVSANAPRQEITYVGMKLIPGVMFGNLSEPPGFAATGK